MRKPISISETTKGWTVICDDGSMWYDDMGNGWNRREDIPQDQNELDKLRSENKAMVNIIKDYDTIKQLRSIEIRNLNTEVHDLNEEIERLNQS